MVRKCFLFLVCFTIILCSFGVTYAEEPKTKLSFTERTKKFIVENAKEIIENSKYPLKGIRAASDFLRDDRFDQEDWSSKDCPYSLKKLGINRCFSDKKSMFAYLTMLNHCKEGRCWEDKHPEKKERDKMRELLRQIEEERQENIEKERNKLIELAIAAEEERKVRKENYEQRRIQEEIDRLERQRELEEKFQRENEERSQPQPQPEPPKEKGGRYCTDPDTGRRWRGPSFRTCNCERINALNKASCFMSQGFRPVD